MNRLTAMIGMLALASCEGSEEAIEAQTSALSTYTLRIYHDDPPRPTGCENRDYAGDGDWAYGLCKTECAVPATGISSSFPAQGNCTSGDAVPKYGSIYRADAPLNPDPGPGEGSTGPFFGFHWEEFTHLLACANNGSPAVVLGSGYELYFGDSNAYGFPNVGYDWAPGLVKGECDNSSAIVGVATSHIWAGDNACYDIPNFTYVWSSTKRVYGMTAARCSTLTNTDPTKVAVAHDCQTVYLDNQSRNEAGNRTSWVGEDWDPGYLKGECGPYRYIKGIAHPELGDQYPARATAILCCSARFDIIP